MHAKHFREQFCHEKGWRSRPGNNFGGQKKMRNKQEKILNRMRNVWRAFCEIREMFGGKFCRITTGQVCKKGECVSMHIVHQETSFMLPTPRILLCQMTSHHELKSYLLSVTLDVDSIFSSLIFPPSSRLTKDRY